MASLPCVLLTYTMRVSALGVNVVQPLDCCPAWTFRLTWRVAIVVPPVFSRKVTDEGWTPFDIADVPPSWIATVTFTDAPAARFPELGDAVIQLSPVSACQGNDTEPVFVSW